MFQSLTGALSRVAVTRPLGCLSGCSRQMQLLAHEGGQPSSAPCPCCLYSLPAYRLVLWRLVTTTVRTTQPVQRPARWLNRYAIEPVRTPDRVAGSLWGSWGFPRHPSAVASEIAWA